MPTNTRWTELTETLVVTWASLAAQTLKNLPAMQETLVQSLGQEDPWRREWLPTQVFLPREFHRQRMVTWVNVILQRVGGLWHGCSGQCPGKSMTPDSWFPPPWILMWLLCNEAWESEFFFLIPDDSCAQFLNHCFGLKTKPVPFPCHIAKNRHYKGKSNKFLAVCPSRLTQHIIASI